VAACITLAAGRGSVRALGREHWDAGRHYWASGRTEAEVGCVCRGMPCPSSSFAVACSSKQHGRRSFYRVPCRQLCMYVPARAASGSQLQARRRRRTGCWAGVVYRGQQREFVAILHLLHPLDTLPPVHQSTTTRGDGKRRRRHFQQYHGHLSTANGCRETLWLAKRAQLHVPQLDGGWRQASFTLSRTSSATRPSARH
jgi:hypothetical protein